MSENKMNGVAITSLLVAAMRAVETKRSDTEGRLFSDPYAEILAGTQGFEILERALTEVGPQPAIAIRTAFIDEKFNEAVANGVHQIVILASGMDSRAYRLNFPPDLKVFELDQPAVLEYKKIKLSHVNPKCQLHSLEVDLREEWQAKLLAAGFKARERTLWCVEGLLMYLDESQVITLFERINSLASPKDILLFDIFNRHLLETPHMKTQLNFLASLGAPWKFGTNDPIEFMKKLGWSTSLTQAGDYAPLRWPFPTAPMHVPNVPRGFYAQALKL